MVHVSQGLNVAVAQVEAINIAKGVGCRTTYSGVVPWGGKHNMLCVGGKRATVVSNMTILDGVVYRRVAYYIRFY